MISGMGMEDVKELSMWQFPEARKFYLFKYWDAYIELMLSPMEAGWPKRMRLNISSDYSSSTGSHDLSDNAEEAPPPVPCRRRPVGKKTAMRMSKGAASSRQSEVQSVAPSLALGFTDDVMRMQ